MRRSFDLKALKQKIKPAVARGPALTIRVALAALLAANLVAAFLVFRPWGGSAEELEQRLKDLRGQVTQRRVALERVRALSAKIDKGRKDGDAFIGKYFLDRRGAYSSLLEELNRVAKSAGVKGRDNSYGFEPIEGSDTLGLLTVTANCEGSYADLLKMVTQLDKSPRFLIMESLSAAPQQSGGVLNISLKLNTFILDSGPKLPPVEQAGAGRTE